MGCGLWEISIFLNVIGVLLGCLTAGEIEGLRERLRAMESREKEKEEEMKALKRSLRNKELSMLSGNGMG